MGRSTSKRRQMQLLAQENSRARMVRLMIALRDARQALEADAPKMTIQAFLGEAETFARREFIAERNDL